MSIIAHHEVIILLESVLVRLLAIYEDASVRSNLQIILLINAYDSLIKRKISGIKLDRSPCLRNPYRTIVITSPVEILCLREKHQI